jgi:ferredoxin
VGVVVVMVGLLFPAGMLPQGDLQRIPGPITIDPLFLFFLPASGNRVLSWSLWGGLLLLTAVFAVLPWLRLRRRSASIDGVALPATLPKVNIIKDRCNGCTVCAMDCPYGAIQMVERTDGKLHKYIAVEDPSLCVSCGICVGSCDVVAVTMGRIPPVMLWEDISSRLTLAKMRNPASQLKVIFTCERHAAHGAKSYLEHSADMPEGTAVEVIPLSCVGTAPPDLLSRTLDEDVAEVQVVGCPPDDCTNREGNLWLEQRLVRERVPRLRRPYANAPISAYWLPPDDFSQAVEAATVLPATSGDEPAID